MLTGGGSCKQGADNHTANAILFGYQNNIHDILFYQYLFCEEEERRVSENKTKNTKKKTSETKKGRQMWWQGPEGKMDKGLWGEQKSS